MTRSILVRNVVPYFIWYGLLFVSTLLFDYILHKFHLIYLGLYFGITGTFLIVISFVYSLQKRKIINWGSSKLLLQTHEALAWIGALMVMVHAGIHFNALLPWLAVFLLIVAVASGLIGKFILADTRSALAEKKKELLNKGMTEKEAEDKLLLDSITVDLMKKWRSVHVPITLVLGVLALLHILSIIMFSK
jgi:hypothetical protein